MSSTEKWLLDGILLDTVTVNDALAMAIARYKIPYRRGPFLENMGLDDRTIKIKCVFLEERYVEHLSFVNKMSSTAEDSHELNHPIFGILFGSIGSINILYDDRELTAEIDFDFIAESDDRAADVQFLPSSVGPQVEEQYGAAQTAQMDKLVMDMADAVGAEAAEIVSVEIDPDLTLLEQFTTASQDVRDYIAEIDTAIARCEATLDTVEIASSSYINTIDYGTGLPGRVVGAMARVCERFCQSGSTIEDSPKSWLSNLEAAFAGLRALFVNDTFNAADQMLYAQSARFSLETAYQYQLDNVAAMKLKSIESGSGFDVLGRRLNSEPMPAIMTINDLDETLYAARALLQQCIDRNRSAGCYKKTAEMLFVYVQEIRLQRHRIITKSIETPMPLFLICVRNDIPIAMADRILSINPDITNPNCVSGEVQLYAA
jgi:hypothetical protein